MDSDTTSDAMRSKLRGHSNAAVYSLVSIPHGYDIATIFELDPTTLTKEPTVPRYGYYHLNLAHFVKTCSSEPIYTVNNGSIVV